MGVLSILIVEDDPDIRELLAFTFAKESWQVSQAETGEEGLSMFRKSAPDCVILDIMLPGMSGLDLLRKIRSSKTGSDCPVILASAKGEDPDIIVGLELGADDYIVKPYSPRVLAARVRAVVRRVSERESEEPRPEGGGGERNPKPDAYAKDGILERAGLRLDPRRREVRDENRTIDLSATEFDLLELLMRDPGRVFTRGKIIELVKGQDYSVTDRAVDVQILSLRKKLEDRSGCIETVRGVGYRFASD
jgi:two-component system phosphate regulon response regulator PhoB